MLRSTAANLFRSTAVLRVWAAEEDDVNAPATTFKNVKPGLALRLWRQIRHRAWIAFTWDEEMTSPNQEGFLHQQRLEQVCFAPLSAYGMVPGSYCDPLLYNTKTTSPFRWHMANVSSDIVGHWYMEADEIFRIKDWQPKNPDDPTELFPRPPQMRLKWDETVDEHGNRTFRYKYCYDFMGPTGMWEAYPRYPFSHLYFNGQDHHGRMEYYGFKQGHLLRCDEEEEEVLRRIMEEEDKEWEMVKRTELVQEPWSYPGKIQPDDFKGAVERAKARFREQIKHGKETDPSEDPEYDLVQAGEFVEPRDGPRAEWRHLWTSNRAKGEQLPYQVTFNDGFRFEDNENKPPVHPQSHYEQTPKEAPYKKYEAEDQAHYEQEEKNHQAWLDESFRQSMEEHHKRYGDTTVARDGQADFEKSKKSQSPAASSQSGAGKGAPASSSSNTSSGASNTNTKPPTPNK